MHKRNKRKLNMLEPGSKLCAVIGIGIMISILLFLIGWHILLFISGSITVLMTIIFVILLVIEAHQDNAQYEAAKKEDPDIK